MINFKILPMLQQYVIATISAVLINSLLIIFNALGYLPFGLYDFIFIFVFFLAAALYQPRFIFWIFIASLPLENIILSPAEIPFSLRPFQFFGIILILATVILWLARKLDFKLLNLRKICLVCSLLDKAKGKCQSQAGNSFGWWDRLVFGLPIFALFGVLNSPNQALAIKLTLVLVSFAALFWLIRNYLQDQKRQIEALWFILVGSKIVILYGLYQALAYKFGWPHQEVMDGRINSTFTEPDWLGLYLVFILALVLWIKLFYQKQETKIRLASFRLEKVVQWLANVFLFFLLASLLLTVARSAWLGMVTVVFIYLVLIFLIEAVALVDKSRVQNSKFKVQSYKLKIKSIFWESLVLIGVGLISLGVIEYFSLSSFHFFNRAASSLSGKQKITISCRQEKVVPMEIENVEELATYSCRHINLEEIEAEKGQGQIVKEIYRPDPNVNIRKNIYLTTWQAIKKHPILGQGLGSSGIILGQDERGAGLNASNIFLENWLSLGLGGLVITLACLVFFPLTFFLKFFKSQGFHQTKGNFSSPKELFAYSLVLLTGAALLIPNLFNAGLFLGIFWLWLGVSFALTNCR